MIPPTIVIGLERSNGAATKITSTAQLEEMYGPRAGWDPLGPAAAAAWHMEHAQPLTVIKVGVAKPVLRFTILGKPVPYARVVPRKATKTGVFQPPFQPAEAKAYQKRFALEALSAANRAGWVCPGPEARIALTIRVYRMERRSDLSNYVKLAEDSINDAGRPPKIDKRKLPKGVKVPPRPPGKVWIDDRQVVSINAGMAVSKSNPRIEVEVRVLP